MKSIKTLNSKHSANYKDTETETQRNRNAKY